MAKSAPPFRVNLGNLQPQPVRRPPTGIDERHVRQGQREEPEQLLPPDLGRAAGRAAAVHMPLPHVKIMSVLRTPIA
jgi:hypothetical protein